MRVEELKFSAKMSASPFLDPLFFFGDFDAEECGGAWYSGRRRRRSRRAWRLYRSSFFKDFERAGSVPALEDDDDGPFALAGPTATLHRERERERERAFEILPRPVPVPQDDICHTHTHISREESFPRVSLGRGVRAARGTVAVARVVARRVERLYRGLEEGPKRKGPFRALCVHIPNGLV